MTIAQINYLNIGLMLVSMIAAFVLPFHVFLFSYAVLGPLHYLSEISWLHDRQYFSKSKYDYLLLVLLCLPILMGTGLFSLIHVPAFKDWGTAITIFAFGISLVLILTEKLRDRFFGGAAILSFALIAHYQGWNWSYLLFSVFVPTLLHVYVFTGAFIIYGALKQRSISGYISFGVFIACAVLLFSVDSSYNAGTITDTIREAYGLFAGLNLKLANLFSMHEPIEALSPEYVLFPFASYDEIFTANASVIISRFIAFAYTYHYLNWFSKTSIIKWHKVPKLRFFAVIAIWAASVALYAMDYMLGFSWLFLLSFMHVFLEFPLNWRSFIGIGEELKKRMEQNRTTLLE